MENKRYAGALTVVVCARALIAIFVYLLGGCAYQRTVMHQRGWRQLPNYGMWAGIGSFVKVRAPPLPFLPLYFLRVFLALTCLVGMFDRTSGRSWFRRSGA